MIFILVPLIFLRLLTRAPGRTKNCMRISADRAPAPGGKSMASFLRECWQFVALYLGVFDWKVRRFCWPKGTSLECVELIYVKTTGAACVSEELCR